MPERRLRVGSGLIWSALAIVALQMVVLAILGTRPLGPVISQALQAVSALLTGLACLQAGFRSTAFARSFWRLSALAFFVWCLARTIGTYHLYAATLHPQLGPRGIILYFLSFTPQAAPNKARVCLK